MRPFFFEWWLYSLNKLFTCTMKFGIGLYPLFLHGMDGICSFKSYCYYHIGIAFWILGTFLAVNFVPMCFGIL